MDQPYTPIGCDEHDQLLALATLRQQMQCTILQPDGQQATLAGVIDDVYTSVGAEYLRLRDGATVRLDRIIALDGRPFGRPAESCSVIQVPGR